MAIEQLGGWNGLSLTDSLQVKVSEDCLLGHGARAYLFIEGCGLGVKAGFMNREEVL